MADETPRAPSNSRFARCRPPGPSGRPSPAGTAERILSQEEIDSLLGGTF